MIFLNLGLVQHVHPSFRFSQTLGTFLHVLTGIRTKNLTLLLFYHSGSFLPRSMSDFSPKKGAPVGVAFSIHGGLNPIVHNKWVVVVKVPIEYVLIHFTVNWIRPPFNSTSINMERESERGIAWFANPQTINVHCWRYCGTIWARIHQCPQFE